MPSGGHNRKPTALKILEGNPGKRPLPSREPKPPPIAPKCPSWLPVDGKKLWRELAPQLERLGLLTQVDGPTFTVLCLAWANLREAAGDLKTRGALVPGARSPGETVRNPSAQHLNAAAQLVLAVAPRFGLDPQARSRIMAAASDDGPTDDMTSILSGLKSRSKEG